ncbi:hypothetical protein PISMIDRAFT_676355, partial [Pisolithus microcarpus 441]
VVSTAFSASLFILCVVLLALSTNESRCLVVFPVNVFAIRMSLTIGGLVGFVYRITVDGCKQVSPLLLSSHCYPGTRYCFPASLHSTLSNTLRAMLSKMLAFSLCVNFARVVVAWLIFQAHAMRLCMRTPA